MRGSEDVSGGAAKEALYDAYEARVADKGSGRTAEQVYLDESSSLKILIKVNQPLLMIVPIPAHLVEII